MHRQATEQAVKTDNIGLVDKTVHKFITSSTFKQILDWKLVLSKDNLVTKDDIEDIQAVIKDQKGNSNVLELSLALME